mgnify:CR=1 FL=1
MKRYIVSLHVYNGMEDTAEKEGIFEIIELGEKKHRPYFEIRKSPQENLGKEKEQLNDGDYSSICQFIDRATEDADSAKAEKILRKINTMLWIKAII